MELRRFYTEQINQFPTEAERINAFPTVWVQCGDRRSPVRSGDLRSPNIRREQINQFPTNMGAMW